MIEAYRLHRSRYSARSGKGAAVDGGRWNPKGTEVVYAAASPSLAVLEILVHYAVLSRDFVLTTIYIPDHVAVIGVPAPILVPGWDSPMPKAATQEYGRGWIAENRSAVLSVPSAVIPREKNYVFNVLHPEFGEINFGEPEPFSFDPRLTKKS